MVVVEVIDKKTKKKYEYYIETKLKNQLDKKVIPTLTKKDEDYIFIIDGDERSGKSTFGMQLGKYIDPSLDLDRVCFTPDEFKKAITTATKGQCVIFDEAFRGLGSSSALSEVNRILKSMMMEMGQKNLFVIIVLPTFYLLEKYVALWRTRCLIHIWKKGYWRLFNSKKKKLLYLNPLGKRYYSYVHVKTNLRGRFYNQYPLNEEEYREKKAKSFKEGFKKFGNDKYMEQRDKLVWILYKNLGESIRNIVKLFESDGVQLKKSQISTIIAKFKGQV